MGAGRTRAAGPAYAGASRLRVVALITGAVVGVGALGGAAGVAFDPEPTRPPPAAPPGDGLPAVSAGESGMSSGMSSGRSVGLRVSAADQESPPDTLTGSFYDLGLGAKIFVPSDWTAYHAADTRVWLMNGRGSFAFAAAGQLADSAVPAAEVLRQNLTGLLPPDVYTQLRTTGPEAWAEPFGTMVSLSVLQYDALWADPQGSVPIYGQIYAGVRQDGAVLVVLIEHVPPDDWQATMYPRAAIPEQSFRQFGGLT